MNNDMKKDMMWGTLLHLGSNMWGEWLDDVPRTPEEAQKKWPDDKPDSHGLLPSRTVAYLRADEALWREETALVKSEGCNVVLIDVGEAYAYPSHPELWVTGSWNTEKMHAEVARLKGLGLEPIPKLNFSTGHDAWLKEYHRLTSTDEYYKVVADVIRDVAEVFDHPRYFHIGYDEEVPVVMKSRQMAIMRQGDLWMRYLVRTSEWVKETGARTWAWFDYPWGIKDFLADCPKDILYSNLKPLSDKRTADRFAQVAGHGCDVAPFVRSEADAAVAAKLPQVRVVGDVKEVS